MGSVAIIGAGAWGTALAVQAARAGNRLVELFARDPVRLQATRESRHLPGIELPEGVLCAPGFPISGFDAIVLAVPVQFMRSVLVQLRSTGPMLVAAKGVEAGTLRLPLEMLAELHPGQPAAVLTGPNFAHEIARGLPAAAVVAAADPALREHFAGLLATPEFRLYGNDDPVGAQLGGAVKNVIAIAAGAVTGAALGENARAALVTRGIAELGRLSAALGGKPETVAGLSGLGDMVLTCTGRKSRNFSLGFALGCGDRLEDVLAGRQSVTEGVATAPALVARAEGVDLPICRAVADLVTGRVTLGGAMAALLARPRRDE